MILSFFYVNISSVSERFKTFLQKGAALSECRRKVEWIAFHVTLRMLSYLSVDSLHLQKTPLCLCCFYSEMLIYLFCSFLGIFVISDSGMVFINPWVRM